MKLFKTSIVYLFLIIVISCGKDEGLEKDIDLEIEVTSIEITTQSQDLLKGSTLQLTVSMLPDNARNKVIIWSSSDDTVASVDTNGLVTGLELGSVNITAKSSSNSSILSSITLEITGNRTNAITSFSIDGKEASLIDDYTWGLQIQNGANLSMLQPTIVHNGETISPSMDTAQDFTEPITYTVTSENGETQEWLVKIIAVQDLPNSTGFITTWITDNPGISDERSIEIPSYDGLIYDYSVDWGDEEIDENITGDASHTYEIPGTYHITIIGDFPRIYFNSMLWENKNDRQKITAINQWGNIEWTSFDNAFMGCNELDVKAIDTPDFTNVSSLREMFRFCTNLIGNESFENWDVSSLVNFSFLFGDAELFNQDIGSWNVSNVRFFIEMFDGASAFNQDIGSWDVSNGIQFNGMFSGAASFNQDISSWDVSNATEMGSTFSGATSFNQDISSWDVSNCTYFVAMFYNAEMFNQNIGNWNVAKADNMSAMFAGAKAFNQNISNWNISNATDINSMFSRTTSFNQDISVWDVSNVTNMIGVFYEATAFNQDIGNWNTSSVTNMEVMFKGATSFDQDLGSWDIGKVSNMGDMFLETGLTKDNYDSLLQGWNSLPTLQNDIVFNGGGSMYCIGETARQNLIDTYGWTITDGGKNCD